MTFKGFIFDLDGTLVDSKLDFEKLRKELGLPQNAPILEAVSGWSPEKQKWAHDVIDANELAGAEASEMYDGVNDFLAWLKDKKRPHAIFTRNSRRATNLTLNKHNLSFTHVITRDEAPAKPNPQGLLTLVKNFGLQNQETLYVGDYLYDLQAGLAAQIPTALFFSQQPVDFDARGAHFTFTHFSQLLEILKPFEKV